MRAGWLSLLGRHPQATAFAAGAAAYLACFAVRGPERYLFDAHDYLVLGRSYFADGSFSLFRFDSPYRGCLFPLLVGALDRLARWTGTPITTLFPIVSALHLAWFQAVLVPRVCERSFDLPPLRLGPILAFGCLLAVLWTDHFRFPLTDFPALSLLLLGVLLLSRASSLRFLLAGLCLGAASNVRPVYLIALLPAVPLAVRLGLRQPGSLRRMLSVGALAAGVLLAWAPQMAINAHRFGTPSPLLQTQHLTSRGLYLDALLQGLWWQRYETSLDPRYPFAAAAFIDHDGHAIARDSRWIANLTDYAAMLAEQPVGMSRLYARHLFNGLDLRYPSAYVRDLWAGHALRRLLDYAVLYAALVGLLLSRPRRLRAEAWLTLAVLLLPVAAILPAHVETRYYLPLHVSLYALVAFSPWASWLRARSRRFWAGHAVAFGVFAVLCFHRSAWVFDQLANAP